MAINKLTGSTYYGGYTITTWRKPDLSYLNKTSAIVDGTSVTIKNGSIAQSMGGLQFYADHSPFTLGYKFIKKIVDTQGVTLWENWDEKE